MPRAWIGIGSNLGDRLAHIGKALELIGVLPGSELVAVSSVYETEPVGGPEQPRFLNAVAELSTELEPRSLLHELLAVEDVCGRVRLEAWGPRTLDLDLLVYEGVEIASEALTLPHPRMTERAFVLVPLSEIAPDLVLPGREETVSDLVGELSGAKEEVERVSGPPGTA